MSNTLTTKELLVYSRRPKLDEGKERQLFDQNHKSNPDQVQDSPGNVSSNLDSAPTSPSIDDIPIALRKGKRACTDHPIYNFVSYKKLSPSHYAFVSNLNKIQVPNTMHKALKVPEWKAASGRHLSWRKYMLSKYLSGRQ
ncbi:hypothetical protein ACH5RR_024811 [Cinchona calisaya]|uniref:Uncharacterized protein n=1 Tax=Cinchona calisaya TaxID=153742 RepID=A0ABD2Z0F7_9GENT